MITETARKIFAFLIMKKEPLILKKIILFEINKVSNVPLRFINTNVVFNYGFN